METVIRNGDTDTKNVRGLFFKSYGYNILKYNKLYWKVALDKVL